MRMLESNIQKTAYSLIELMVVVAIVGLLSVIGVPIYRNYVTTGRISTALGVITGLVQDTTDFANGHGRFPQLHELGYTAGTRSSVMANPSGLNQYLNYIRIADVSTNFGFANACGAVGIIAGTFNPTAVGLSAQASVSFACELVHKNSTIDTWCYYTYNKNENVINWNTALGSFPSAASGSQAELIPGWVNAEVNNQTVPAQVTAFAAGASCL